MKIDNYYKFILCTFAIVYFVGLVIGLIFIQSGYNFDIKTDYKQNFNLINNQEFRSEFITTFKQSLSLLLLPFNYVYLATIYGYEHMLLLTSSILGQVNLVIVLLSQIFYFLAYVIFTTISLKIIIFIIIKIVNKILNKRYKYTQIKISIFNKNDTLMFYLSIIFIALGAFIKIYISKIIFMFLINLQLITYIVLVYLYILIVIVSLYTTYKIIKSVIEDFNKKKYYIK